MRGLNPQLMQAQTPQAQPLTNPQTLGLLMQAYKGYQDSQTPLTPGATGADYAGSQMQGTGYGIGQPLVAGGASGQSNPQYSQLLQAMMQAREMGQ